MKKLANRFAEYLRSRGLFKTLAFVRALPELIAAVAGIYAALTLKDGDRFYHILKDILAVVLTIWWGLRWWDHHYEEKKAMQKAALASPDKSA